MLERPTKIIFRSVCSCMNFYDTSAKPFSLCGKIFIYADVQYKKNYCLILFRSLSFHVASDVMIQYSQVTC